MPVKRLFITFNFFILLLVSPLAAQIYSGNWHVDSIIVVEKAGYEFNFPSRHRPKKPTLVIKKNKLPMQELRDYDFKSERTIVFFPPPTISDTLEISYQREPFNLKSNYALFRKDSLSTAISDSISGDSVKIKVVPVSLENPFADFGSGLQKSGSIMRGVSIGSNRDLTLNSGLNLELSGQLTENVEIVAALTDETTPIQPEGNTQSLEEVDRVFVQFKSPYIEGTVGDLNLEYKNTQFADLTRKLQGISLLGNYADQYAGATIATTRGFFNRMVFIGQEGNQGPYQLNGKDGEREIIVLAGTERVWINGQKMLRGESNDYVIEYANGQITFTNNRLITSESRIEIDYEYFPAFQKYNRNAISGISGGKIFNSKLDYRISFFQEADNIDQALGDEENLTDTEKKILKQAGDNILKSSVPGENFVGAGKGNYTKTDTIYIDSTYTIFKYAGTGKGDYFVSFTYLGSGRGAYTRDRIGQYRWIGPNRGDYSAIKLIPLPQKHQLLDFSLQYNPTQKTKISTEYALSNLDRNTLSGIQNSDNKGSAFFMDARTDDWQPKIMGNNIGSFDFNINTRHIAKNFQAVDRVNQPDYQRYWNVLQNDSVSNEESSVQFNSVYKPVSDLSFGINLGSLQKDKLDSRRWGGRMKFDRKNIFVSELEYESIQSELAQDDIKNNWNRLNGKIHKDIWKIQPQLMYQYENRQNKTPIYLSGFRFDDYGLRLGLINWDYFSGYAQANKRYDKVYDVQGDSRLVPQSETNTQLFRIELQNVNETSASLEIVHRNKDYTKRFENIKIDTLKLLFADASVQDTVWQDRETNLAELRISHSRWKKAVSANLQYRISTEQTALREKVYVEVEQGRGNLRFDEDLQEYVPDPDGNYVLFILPSGQFEPVTKLESALRVNYDPSRIWRKASSKWQSFLSNLSGSSYFRVEEETKESDLMSVYLLNLSKFQKDLTLRGSLVYDQDVYIMKSNRDLNFRLQYRYRDDLFNQFLDPGENEDRLTIERGFRTDWRLSSQIKTQSEISQKLTKRDSKANSSRNRNIDGLYLAEKIFYKPFSEWEFRLNLDYGKENNTAQTYPLDLWFAVGKTEANYILPGKGRVTADFEYQTVNVVSNPLRLTVPFEMARGKKEGVSKKWQLRAEYTVSQNILFTLLYTGRDDAGFTDIIHTGQAEVRAFF
ncbi:MAG: hypothetical protein H6627_04890 [Calditrichae bacterium]|nr:hypothetical protein [Calditrichota bacterium]MCB9057879.1 hypothetical protein [Calditrichia bacterium]